MGGPGARRDAPPTLVLATANGGKLRELRRLLAQDHLELISALEAGFEAGLEEPADSYAENARAKALAVSRATGLATLADDSGIEIAALSGWPGCGSARWMGQGASDADRLRGLLGEVERRCPTDRRALYVAALAICRAGGAASVVHGACEGTLVQPRGGGGFGYDPGFHSSDLGKRFSEASGPEKDMVSHRGRAVRLLRETGLLAAAVAAQFPLSAHG